MRSDRLYIIGNGFDIHHGIPSKYSDFKRYLSDSDHSLLKLVEEYLPYREDWSNLEQALANIDTHYVVDRASEYLVPYSAEDWSDSYHHDYSFEIGTIIKGLSEGLKTRFTEWITDLHIPSPAKVGTKILNLDMAATYLTFNYTSTLSTTYKVPRANVLYIHGEAESQNQDIILGHGWNPRDIPSLNNVPNPASLDTRVMEGNEIINRYFGVTFKNTSSIIAANQSFFNGLSDMSKIYVLGHSISEVDIPYFNTIIQSINADKVHWRISYHGNDELMKHQKTMNQLGIENNKLSFCALQDL